MKRLLLLLGIVLASMSIALAQCTGQPFGTNLGSFNGVPAYSNCYPTFDSNTYNPAGTGLEWQCVEFVRRYYAQVYGASVSKSNLGNANQWFNNYAQLGLERFSNGGSTPLQPGDIITSLGPAGSNGHIAIVQSVSSNQACAVMQNWSEGAADINGTHCMSLTNSGSNYFLGSFDKSEQYQIQGWLRWPGSSTTSPATMNYPPNGSTLAGPTVIFQWTTGVGVQQYFLYVGNSVGSNDIYGQSEGTNISATVTNVPTDGRSVYVTLWSYINGSWHANNYTYTAARIGVTPVPAALWYPTPGSMLSGSSATFEWNAGSGIQQYFLYVGSTFGGNDIYGQSQGTNRAATVYGIPTDGRTLYVRLWSYSGSIWYYRDYTYRAF